MTEPPTYADFEAMMRELEAAGILVRTGRMQRSRYTGELIPEYTLADRYRDDPEARDKAFAAMAAKPAVRKQ